MEIKQEKKAYQILQLEAVDFSINGKRLLSDVSLKVNSNDRIGIIGRNGSGKSHLLKLLAGDVSADAGNILFDSDIKIVLVKQNLPDDEMSPLDYLRELDSELQALYDQSENTTDDAIYSELLNKAGEIENERYDILAPQVLKGLGLTETQIEAPMRDLSGGLRMRVGLASALIQAPDLLLLDEPTNHLDLESAQWLIQYLQAYKKAFLVVSHDIKLLNTITTKTLHLKQGNLIEFHGSYEAYLKESAITELNTIKKNKDLEKEAKQAKEIYYQFRGIPSRAAQAVQQSKRADDLRSQIVEILPEEPVIPIHFKDPIDVHSPMIELENASIGYSPDKCILKNLNISINYGVKIGLIGRNGEGKSTFIKQLVNLMPLVSGDMIVKPKCKIGYFSQDLMDQFDKNLSVYQQFSKATTIKNDETIRQSLGMYGFPRDKVNVSVTNLSGGELSRLALAIICSSGYNLIIFDEPTNHLDVETREVLIKAIQDFKGSVLLVSHDWDLHKQSMKEFWVVNKGAVRPYKNGLDDYCSRITQFASAQVKEKSAAKTTVNSNNSHAFTPNIGAKTQDNEKQNVTNSNKGKAQSKPCNNSRSYK